MNEDELIELLTFLAPETLEGWLAWLVIICAFLAVALPAPAGNAHPLWKVSHRLISIIGLGAGKMRAAGKLGKIGKIASIFRKKP